MLRSVFLLLFHATVHGGLCVRVHRSGNGWLRCLAANFRRRGSRSLLRRAEKHHVARGMFCFVPIILPCLFSLLLHSACRSLRVSKRVRVHGAVVGTRKNLALGVEHHRCGGVVVSRVACPFAAPVVALTSSRILLFALCSISEWNQLQEQHWHLPARRVSACGTSQTKASGLAT